jgi:NAD(P)-dependent dehydrogenase (short-subunit alcohol dehydrogenase family)
MVHHGVAREPPCSVNARTMRASIDPDRNTSIRYAFDLTGQRAVVTGASRGAGRAIAYAHEADLRDPSAIDATIDRACDELGGIEIVVNNAADSQASPIEETEVETWQPAVELNLGSCWLLCHAASSALREGDGGSVINIASILGLVASRNESAYIAAKHGLVGLTRALALEWARRGVRVNAIEPGYVETAMTGEYLADDAFGGSVRRSTPQGRWAQPKEVTGAAIFMAARASSFVIGQVLVVDGGSTVQ